VYTAEAHQRALLTKVGMDSLLALLCDAVPLTLHEQTLCVMLNATSLKDARALGVACQNVLARAGHGQGRRGGAGLAQRGRARRRAHRARQPRRGLPRGPRARLGLVGRDRAPPLPPHRGRGRARRGRAADVPPTSSSPSSPPSGRGRPCCARAASARSRPSPRGRSAARWRSPRARSRPCGICERPTRYRVSGIGKDTYNVRGSRAAEGPRGTYWLVLCVVTEGR